MSSVKLFFRAHGKLMLFGEYVVMRGVPALAFPIQFGQVLEIESSEEFIWESFELDQLWFRAKFTKEFEIIETNNSVVAGKLMDILIDIASRDKFLFNDPLKFVANSNFNRHWGFGSSATLISLLSQWSNDDAYVLNERHFSGSGYDIACAVANTPILYYRDTREVHPLQFPDAITQRLLFVYLGNKQNSKSEVSKFSEKVIEQEEIEFLTALVLSASQASSIETFENIIDSHEEKLSKLLNRPTLKSVDFPDYPYSIKSLGAWGGDFFMATCRNLDEARMYFIEQGKEVIFTWNMLAVQQTKQGLKDPA